MSTGANTLYSNFFWKCLQFAAAFCLNLAIARILGASLSADFYYLIYILSGCITIFTLGLDIGISHFLPRKAVSPVTVGRLILMSVGLALAVSIPLLALFIPVSNNAGLDRPAALLFAFLHITGGLLTALSGAIFTVYGRNDLPSKLTAVMNILLALIFVLGSSWLAMPELLAAWFVFSFVQGVFLFVLAARRYGILRGSRKGETIGLNQLLRYSLTAFVINLLFFFGTRLNLYLMPYRLASADQGNYIQAYKLVEYMGLVMSFVYYPVIVLVAGTELKKMTQTILFLVRLSNTVVLAACALGVSIGWWLFPLLFGPSFGGLYEIFICLVPGIFAVCSSGYFTAWYFGSGHIRYNAFSACILGLAMLAGFFLLPAPRGTAMAFSIASLLSLAYDLWIFRRFEPWSPQDILFLRGSDLSALKGFIGNRVRLSKSSS